MRKLIAFFLKLPENISFWFWFNFKATEEDKIRYDQLMYGGSLSKNGKRINPKKFRNHENIRPHN